MSRITGTVKWFNAKKGFGFIVADELGESDIFVHYRNITMAGYKSLKNHQQVTFDLLNTNKGISAVDVKPT